MDLTHRVANQKSATTPTVLHKITAPLTYLIPLGIVGLSFYQVWPYFGDKLDTGTLSLVFIPFIGQILSSLFSGKNNVFLSTIILIGYVFGPVSFFMYVWFVTKRHLPAIIAALISLLPLFPFSPHVPERLSLALVDRDGGHILGLTIVPWIAIVYHLYLRSGQVKWQYVAALLSFIVGLISFFTFTISLVVLFYVSISEALVSEGRVKMKRFAILAVVIVAILGLVYNVSLFSMLASNSGRATVAVLVNFLPLTFFIVPILGTFAFLIFDRRPQLQPLFLSLALTVTFALLHLVRTSFVEVSLFDRDRYAAELSFSAATLVGVLVLWIFELMRQGIFVTNIPTLLPFRRQVAIGIVGILVCILLAAFFFIPREL